jgi:hypothetical protein
MRKNPLRLELVIELCPLSARSREARKASQGAWPWEHNYGIAPGSSTQAQTDLSFTQK